MSYETVKSFVLAVLVGISFLLTFILWSYQPNYDYFDDASYVNEVDIGGVEKARNDVIQPQQIVFWNNNQLFSFIDPLDQEAFYQEISSVVLYDYNVSDRDEDTRHIEYIEIIFPDEIPAELLPSLFIFEDEITPPTWSFQKIHLTFNDENRTLNLAFLSEDGAEHITATIEKSETYNLLGDYIDGDPLLEEYLVLGQDNSIYIPRNPVELDSKTLVASQIEPEEFIDALFTNPNLVTPNMREAYFTDGQRGMRVIQDGRRLEFINPIQASTGDTHPTATQLFEQSVTNINDHKGWTNNYIFDELNLPASNITYRLYYDGYPIFNDYSLSVMKQSWKDQVLFEYERPLIQIGNLLNTEEMELASGQSMMEQLQQDRNYELEDVQDIKIGYDLRYLGDNHSLVLEPGWFILYNNNWIQYDYTDQQDNLSIEGGGD